MAQLAKAQTATPPGNMEEVQAYSIFYENYKGDSYEEAIRFGRWIWKSMPESIEGYSGFDLKRNLNRLAKTYNNVAKEKEDPSLQEAYVDTALMIYEKMVDKYSDSKDLYSWHINRGRMLQEHSNVIDDAALKASEDYYEAFKLRPEEFVNFGDGYYMKVMLQEMSGEGQKDRALAVMKEAEQYANEDLKSYFNDIRGELFDTPEEQMAFLEEQLEDDPENIEILNSLKDIYEEQGMSEEARQISEKLYELNPTYDNIMTLAELAISNANYDRAIKFLKEAMDKAESDKQRADIALQISDAYLNSDRLQNARKFARTAIDHDADWGKPYIQIADIYARAVNVCTDDREMDRKDKVVYWVVLDYLDKAEQVDSNTANEVSRKYDSYSPVIPTTEEKFFWEPPLNEGDEFTIDSSLRECYGWIDETTTVR